jgi:hypothetical protein
VGALAWVTVDVDRRPPALLGQRKHGVSERVVGVDPDGELQPEPDDVLDERVHPGTGVAADQHPVANIGRQLGEGGVEDRDLVGGVVGVGPPGAQHPHQRLSGAPCAVVNEGQQRVNPEAPLEVRSCAFLLRVCPDQRGIQIDHHRTADRDRRAVAPDLRPRRADRGDRGRPRHRPGCRSTG